MELFDRSPAIDGEVALLPVGPLREAPPTAAGDAGGLTGEPTPSLVTPLLTVMVIVAEADRPSPTSVYERTTVAVPMVAGVNVRPLSAALRLASVPSIVIDADLFVPDENVIPVVVPNVSVPSTAVSVSGSTALPALTSEMLTAFLLAVEKTRDAPMMTVADDGAVIAGGLKAFTVSATLDEAD